MNTTIEAVKQPTEAEQAKHVWTACLEVLKEQVNSQSFKTWFEPIVPLSLEGGRLVIQVPSQFFFDWLEEHYNELIKGTITKVLGSEAFLEYSVASDGFLLETEYQPPPTPPQEKRTYPPQPTSRSPSAPA